MGRQEHGDLHYTGLSTVVTSDKKLEKYQMREVGGVCRECA